MREILPLFRAALVALVITAPACRDSVTAPGQVALGAPFDLRAGSSTTVQGGLTIGFDRTVSDSRCPIDAICISEGSALLRIWLVASSGRDDLDIRTDRSGNVLTYASFTITLQALSPYPRSDRPAQPGDYVATFVVVR